MENNTDTKSMKYSEAVAELEAIVAKMQEDNCDIDSLAGYTSRALTLLKFCKEKLHATDLEVRRCLDSMGDASINQ